MTWSGSLPSTGRRVFLTEEEFKYHRVHEREEKKAGDRQADRSFVVKTFNSQYIPTPLMVMMKRKRF